ncbi:Uncharacterized protein SCF082_LOCUS17760, partial [Durusdinium trenchii]
MARTRHTDEDALRVLCEIEVHSAAENDVAKARRDRQALPVLDHAALSQALGLLGAMELAGSLRDLSKAATSGATILVGFKRGSGFKLAAHLTNDRDIDHVEQHGLRGFSSDTLRDRLQEAEAIAKRAGKEARIIRRVFREAWTYSDSAAGFVRALEEKGNVLARGDRGGYVALDLRGEIQAVPKWAGLKTKQVRARLGDPKTLFSFAEAKAALRRPMRPV